MERDPGLLEKNNVNTLSIEDEGYPECLKHIYDPPQTLFVKGGFLKQDSLAVAIVGTRHPTVYGRDAAQRIAVECAAEGLTVVSGLARGIDTAAHKGALKAGGRTIAVLGSGILNIYPKQNQQLAEEIAENGAVITEFPVNAKPLPINFPQRNRIISGLSLAVVVVEAAARSGSLITAHCALEQGREVFALPGLARSVTSQGTHQLLKEGARLVETAQDILEELNLKKADEKIISHS